MTKYYAGKEVTDYSIYTKGVLLDDYTEGKNLSPREYSTTTEVIYHVEGTEKIVKQNQLRDEISYSKSILSNKIVTNIHIDHLFQCDENWNPYPAMDLDTALNMRYSIEKHGILSPGIVIKKSEDHYIMLDGFQRSLILTSMFKKTENKDYEFFPCFVLEDSEINDVMARDIIIDANINKKCSSITKVNVILAKLGIEKQKENHQNSAHTRVAKSVKMSSSTIYNYSTLEKCITAVRHLLEIGQLSLTSCRKLSSYAEETQKEILKQFGLEDIRDCMVKILPKNLRANQAKIYADIFKSRENPYYKTIIIKGKFEDITEIEKTISKEIESKDYKDIKVKIKGNFYDFNVGFSHLNTRRMAVPNYYQEKYLKDK